jgi:hypothetical protein
VFLSDFSGEKKMLYVKKKLCGEKKTFYRKKKTFYRKIKTFVFLSALVPLWRKRDSLCYFVL